MHAIRSLECVHITGGNTHNVHEHLNTEILILQYKYIIIIIYMSVIFIIETTGLKF